MFRSLVSLVLFFGAACAWAADRASTVGLYPLWENTGFVEHAGRGQIGTSALQIGIRDVAHVGVQPLGFAYRTPNAYTKFVLARGGELQLALQVGVHVLLEGAATSAFSPLYASRLDNHDFRMYLVPVALASTWILNDWIHLHQTFTAMTVAGGGAIQTEVIPTYSLVAEFFAFQNHSLGLHASEVGFHRHDYYLAGFSYRYSSSWFEARLGYFYRFREIGTQGGPLLSVGILF